MVAGKECQCKAQVQAMSCHVQGMSNHQMSQGMFKGMDEGEGHTKNAGSSGTKMHEYNGRPNGGKMYAWGKAMHKW